MESKSEQKMALMEANNLSYKFDDILNVSKNRTMKKQYFDTRSYTMPGAGQAVSTWNSGVDLIDCRNSYLKFKVTFKGGAGDTAVSFGQGTAMNLIREVKVMSASGVELSRTQDANLYHYHMSKAKKDVLWQSTTGALMGGNMGDSIDDVANNGFLVILIPLCELDPFFDLYDGKLLPANVASGMRVEITWEDLDTAIVNPGIDVTSYEISEIEFRTEAVTLSDSALAILNREAATDGLELTYDRIFTTSKNTGLAMDDNIEVRKAVSLCKGVYCVTIPTSNRTDQSADSFMSAPYAYSSSDVRLGNQYYPFQPIENEVEGYFHWLKQFNKLKTSGTPAVQLRDFKGHDGDVGFAAICANFETDDSLNLTGLPVNSSRIVEVRFTRRPGTSESIKSYVFLTYTALARCSLSNASVKI